MEKHLKLLGLKVQDRVTGSRGVVTTMSFDLYGCIQAIVSPPVDDEGRVPEGRWYDVTRLEVTDNTPVMPVPDFSAGYIAEGKKGPAEKPARG